MKKLVVAFLLVVQVAVAAEIWPDDDVCSAAESPGSAKKKIEVAKGVWAEVSFEITTKGNGSVALPGLFVRVYDGHDDGLVFRDGLLRCEWQREGDRIDFVVSGFAERTDGKKEAVPVHGVFRYSTKERRFE